MMNRLKLIVSCYNYNFNAWQLEMGVRLTKAEQLPYVETKSKNTNLAEIMLKVEH